MVCKSDHSLFNQVFKRFLFWIRFIHDIKGNFIQKEMSNNLISARLSLVNHIIDIILFSIGVKIAFKDFGQWIVTQLKKGMIIIGVIIQLPGRIDDLMGSIGISLKEKSSEAIWAIKLGDSEGSCHEACEVSFGGGWLLSVSPVIDVKGMERVFELASKICICYGFICIETIVSSFIKWRSNVIFNWKCPVLFQVGTR